jgi:hypothetical protein
MATSIPTGAITLFRQPTAPVRWTKNITYDDYALRVTSGTVGTGGTNPFSTVNATNVSFGVNYNITSVGTNAVAGSLTNHSHGSAPNPSPTTTNIFMNDQGGYGFSKNPASSPAYSTLTGYSSTISGAVGGGGTHSHPTLASTNGLPMPGGYSYNFGFSLTYIDVILCTRTG